MKMAFSKNTEHVASLVDFVLSGGVLSHPYAGCNVRWSVHIVKNPTRLERFRSSDEEGAEIYGNAYLDIKREWSSPISTRPLPYTREDLDSVYQIADTMLYPYLAKQHGELLAISEINEMWSDMITIMLTRISIGRMACAYEDLYTVYESGGFPCGWRGAYPNGSLVVFDSDAARAETKKGEAAQ